MGNIIWLIILFGGISLISYLKDTDKKRRRHHNTRTNRTSNPFNTMHKAAPEKKKLEDKTEDDVYKKYDDFFDDYDKKYK